jgi:hypothetical protein
MTTPMTLVRPERDEELRIEAESQMAAGAQACPSDIGDGFTWCIRKDPDVGPMFILRNGDYCGALTAPQITGDNALDAKAAELAWRKMARRIARGMPQEAR